MTQVAKKQDNAVAVIDQMFEADTNYGLEIGQEDLALPFLRVLSQQSPELESIEGSKAGMIINTVTNKIYDGSKGVLVLPCYYERKYIEWAPRGSGSGAPVNTFQATSDILSKTFKKPGDSKDYLENGNYVETTAQHYVIVLDESGSHPALVTMKSTQLKKSRKWNSMIMTTKLINKDGRPYNPAPFSHVYRLFTSKESNDKGTWYGWEIERVGKVEDAQLPASLEAKAFYEAIEAGTVQVKHTEEDGAPRVRDTDAF
jgi:hypothetical protein